MVLVFELRLEQHCAAQEPGQEAIARQQGGAP